MSELFTCIVNETAGCSCSLQHKRILLQQGQQKENVFFPEILKEPRTPHSFWQGEYFCSMRYFSTSQAGFIQHRYTERKKTSQLHVKDKGITQPSMSALMISVSSHSTGYGRQNSCLREVYILRNFTDNTANVTRLLKTKNTRIITNFVPVHQGLLQLNRPSVGNNIE